ncbi:hypothetical protein D030_3851B, partial [Vibrio parahaemolyticus AQ3810]
SSSNHEPFRYLSFKHRRFNF